MTFLAPAVLAGLAALSLPVIIHLLNKLRVREVHWAAMRFLLTAAQRNQRRLKMQDLLLLILRCAALALLVFAFARPTFKSADKAGAAAADGPLSVMVLLDQSASMGASDGVQTRFEAARASALTFLEGLPSGSSAGLLLAHNGYASPVARPSRNLSLVRRNTELARLTDRGTDFQPALRAAVETLRGLSGRREIHLFTDNQLSGWAKLESIREFLKAAPEINVVIHAAAPASTSADNLALTSLTPDTAIPVAGQPFRVLVEVTNFGSAPVDGVRVTLAVDGDAPSADAVIDRLAPGGSRFVPLLVRLPASGFHALTAAIPSDRLTFDNRRVFALEIAPPRDVLVVESRSGPAPWQGSGHFLATALAPVDEADAPSHYLRVIRTTAAGVDASKLSGYSSIFLCVAEPLPDAVVAALADYVRSGGGLIVMPGDATPASAYASAPWPDLLPARLEPPVESAAGALEAGPYNAALLTPWNDRASGNLSAIRVARFFPLVEPAPQSSVLLRGADGSPFILERTVGRGRVVLFAAPPLPGWTNLPLHPAFVPLMHRLYAATARTSSTRLNLAPGETFQAVVPIEQLNRDVYVRGPSPDARPAAVGRVELVGTQAMLRIRDTAAAGRYAVYIGQNEQTDLLFAVQPPADESDLRVAAPEVLTSTAAAPTADARAATSAPSLPLLSDLQLWTGVLIAAAVLSLAELLCALRASRSR